jgi:serine/threonine protein kinase
VSPWNVGDTLAGRYDLRRVLGRGGLSTVFEAHHRFTGRRLAVKVLHGDWIENAEARERLLLEARALGAVRHPYVVEVHDAGMDRGAPFIVQELCEGRSLEGLISARGRLSPADAARVAQMITDALTAVHAAGMVHRDIKSANVLIVRGPHGEEARLLDFGVAFVPRERGPRITALETVLGTPEYMAPEQLLGQQDIDVRADVFGVGVVLFECLTGRTPFHGSYQEVLVQSATAPIPTVASVRGDVPAALSAVVERCLRHQRAERYHDARSLIAALEATGLTRAPTTLLTGAFDEAAEIEEYVSPSGQLRRRAAPQRDAPVLSIEPEPMDSERPTSISGVRKPLAPPPLPGVARRQHVRAPYATPVRITAALGPIDGRTEDLSRGGVLVLTGRDIPLGERVTLKFALPTDGGLAHCDAIVRWVRRRPGRSAQGVAMGLQFIDAPEALTNAVETWLKFMAA